MTPITSGPRRRWRTTLVLAGTTALLGGITSVLPPAASAATVDTSASYVLGAVNEGAEPLYRNGRTMIVYSASACWGPDYKLGLLTLTGSDPLNRAHWTKSPHPVFQRNDANGVYAPGHNGFFTSPDGSEDWIVYHANDSASGGCDMNRSTRAQKFTWNADGTPNFGTPARLGTRLAAPSGEPVA